MAVIYREFKSAWLDGGEYPSDSVKVELRKWVDRSTQDYVCEATVIVDGTEQVHAVNVETGYRVSDADMIRRAIAQFDALLGAHPSKDKLQ